MYGSQLADYEVIKQLGRGANAFVYQVRSRQSGTLHALKVIDKENLRKHNLVPRIQCEIQVHSLLKHP